MYFLEKSIIIVGLCFAVSLIVSYSEGQETSPPIVSMLWTGYNETELCLAINGVGARATYWDQAGCKVECVNEYEEQGKPAYLPNGAACGDIEDGKFPGVCLGGYCRLSDPDAIEGCRRRSIQFNYATRCYPCRVECMVLIKSGIATTVHVNLAEQKLCINNTIVGHCRKGFCI